MVKLFNKEIYRMENSVSLQNLRYLLRCGEKCSQILKMVETESPSEQRLLLQAIQDLNNLTLMSLIKASNNILNFTITSNIDSVRKFTIVSILLRDDFIFIMNNIIEQNVPNIPSIGTIREIDSIISYLFFIDVKVI